MPLDHIVPRFLLARWGDSETGKIEVADLEARELRHEDPKDFYKLPDFNTIVGANGEPLHWLEQQFLAGLDSDTARYLKRLENLQPPRRHLRAAKKNRWHLNHLTSPRASVRLAMFAAAQAVRSPVWREAVNANTAEAMKRHVEERVQRDLSETNDPEERARLEQLLGLRYYADVGGAICLPHLSGHLAYRIGEVLYGEYMWAVHRFPEPWLLLGDDPLLIMNCASPQHSGSYAQVATANGAALSLYDSRERATERAVSVMRDNDRILLPLGPRHMLVLSRLEHLWPPGMYDQERGLARVFNTLMMKASRRWLCCQPGAAPPYMTPHTTTRTRRASVSGST